MARPDMDALELSFGLKSAGFKQAQKDLKNLFKEAAILEKDGKKVDQQKIADAQKLLKVKEKDYLIEKKKLETSKAQLNIYQRAGLMGRRAGGAAFGVARTAAGLGMSALGGVGGLFLGAVQAAYGKHVEHKQALGQSIGLLGARDYRKAAYGSGGTRYGFSLIDVANMIPSMGRATGTGNVREMMQARRATGMSIDEVAGGFGAIRDQGASFAGRAGGSEGSRHFVNLMALGVESGLKKAEFHKFLSGVSSILRRGLQTSGEGLDATKIGSELAIWGKYGGAGMRGVYGAQKYQQFMQSIARPGGGEWGEAFMMQAQGWGKPGGFTDYYTALRNRQDPNQSAENIRKVMGEARSQFGVGQEANMNISNMTGLSLPVVEQLQKIYDSNMDMSAKDDEIKDVLEKNKSIEEQALDAMRKSNTQSLTHIARLTDIGITLGEEVAPFVEDIQMFLTTEGVKLTKEIIKLIKSGVEIAKSTLGWFTSTADEEQKQAHSDYLKSKYATYDPKKHEDPMAFLEAQTDIAKEAYMSTINALGTSNLNAYKSHSWTGGSNPRLENLKTQASEHGLSESVLDTQRLILSSVPDKDKKAVLEQMQQGANKILAFGSGVSQLPASLGGSVVNKALGTAEGISETAGYKEAVTAFNRIGDTLERVSKPYLNAAGEFDKGIKVDIEVKAAPGTAAVILGSRTNK